MFPDNAFFLNSKIFSHKNAIFLKILTFFVEKKHFFLSLVSI